MFFDETVKEVPSFIDFESITNYKDFSWKEAGISAGISCASALMPIFSSADNSRKIAVGLAAFGGAATGMATEFGKQYDVAIAKLEKQKKETNIENVLPIIEWTPIFVSAGVSGAITGVSTFIVTSPKYTVLLGKIKTKLGATNANLKSKLTKFVEGKLAKSKAGVNGAGNTPALLAKWDNLTISEAKSLYNQIAKTEIQGSKIVRTQSEILQEVQQRGITNPYNFSHPIEDFTLTNDAFFVRAYNQNKTGRWLISIDDVDGFASVDDFIKKTALPVVDEFGTVLNPDKMALVKVPSGTTIRKSVARPQDWGGQGHLPGGATQYEIIEFNWQSMGEWYKEMGIISDFIK